MKEMSHDSLKERRKEVDTKRTTNKHVLLTTPCESSIGTGLFIQ